MNIINVKIKEISSWQCPDDFRPTDAVITADNEVFLLNSTDHYFSMSPSDEDMNKTVVSQDLVRVEPFDKDRYLFVSLKEGVYTCYLTDNLSLEGAENIDLGSDATEIAFNESTNDIWFVNTSKELRKYNLDTKENIKLSEASVKSIYLSVNNKYVAFEDTNDDAYVASTDDVNRATKHTLQGNNEILGVMNDGNLVTLELGLAAKNGSGAVNQLKLVSSKDIVTLASNVDYSWGILQGTKVVTYSTDGIVSLHELSE